MKKIAAEHEVVIASARKNNKENHKGVKAMLETCILDSFMPHLWRKQT